MRYAAAPGGGGGGRQVPARGAGGEAVQVAEKPAKGELGYVPSREELEEEEKALLQAAGSIALQQREEAYLERKRWREKNPSPLDKWENDMEAMRQDTQRRKLWGDLKKKSGDYRRYRGKRILEKETEIKYNRGFPVEDPQDDDDAAAQQDKKWIDMWRAAWPDETAIDPHDPESFGFALVGEITGAHGIHGDVRVRADDFVCDQGYDPAVHLARRNYSNWTEPSKRVHIKAPHRKFPRAFRIITGKKVQSRVYALRLQGVETAEEAVKLRGYKVYALEPPPAASKDEDDKNFSGYDLYDASTTKFATHDALELVGAKCYMLLGDVADEELAEYAAAETPAEAQQVLARVGAEARPFGNVSAVVPDFKISPRFRSRKSAHDLLDITLLREVAGGEGRWLYEPDPASPEGRYLGLRGVSDQFERVVYVPFVPDMIARVEANETGGSSVYFTLPKGHIEATSFTCRKRIVDEKGLLAIPRGANVKALLPPPGKSHALRRRDGKRLPLHGTAPAPPADMPQFAGVIFPEPAPGVPKPPEFKEQMRGGWQYAKIAKNMDGTRR